MRRLFQIALIALVLGPVPGRMHRFPIDDGSQRAAAHPLAVRAATSGMLRYVHGWRLDSPNSHFGGFSGLARLGTDQFLLIGDNGRWSRLTLGADGALSDVTIRRLPTPPRSPKRKAYSDSEALVVDLATGKNWVALERINQIWRLDAAMTRIESRRLLPTRSGWSKNQGPEAMVRLADGRTILFSEQADRGARGGEALVYSDDPAVPGKKPLRFYYDAEGKGLVSDAAPLPDGRILLVHRKLGLRALFTTRLAIVDPTDMGQDTVVRSVLIGTVPRALRENYEGAAIAVEEGRTYLWLVSDDNFNSWQRSLLLKFELVGLPPRQQKGGAVASPP